MCIRLWSWLKRYADSCRFQQLLSIPPSLLQEELHQSQHITCATEETGVTGNTP
jgi:hypothetical protein